MPTLIAGYLIRRCPKAGDWLLHRRRPSAAENLVATMRIELIFTDLSDQPFLPDKQMAMMNDKIISLLAHEFRTTRYLPLSPYPDLSSQYFGPTP